MKEGGLDAASDVPVCEVPCVDVDGALDLLPAVERTAGIADIFKALADDTRVKVVYALSEAELCVCEIAALIGTTTAVASYHLRLLHHMGLATFRRAGKLVYYRLTDPHIGNLVREVMGHLEESRRGRAGVAAAPTVKAGE